MALGEASHSGSPAFVGSARQARTSSGVLT